MNLTEIEYNRHAAYLYRDGTYCITTRHHGGSNIKKARKKLAEQRKFRIDRKKVRSAILACWHKRRAKQQIVLAVTIPQRIPEKKVQKAWVNFVKNLVNNRNIRGYVWVKELQSNGNVHYHILLDTPYLSIHYAQEAWESAILHATGIHHVYHNSVRLGKRPIVKDTYALSHYFTKYFAKGDKDKTDTRSEVFASRAYGYSKGYVIKTEVDIFDLITMLEEYPSRMYVNDSFMIVGGFYSNRSINNVSTFFDGQLTVI